MPKTIEVISSKVFDFEGDASRSAHIGITDGVDTFAWSVGGLPLTGDLQTMLDSRADELWNAAQKKGNVEDILEQVSERDVLKATVALLLDEINIVRELHGLAPRTSQQFVAAIKNKLE